MPFVLAGSGGADPQHACRYTHGRRGHANRLLQTGMLAGYIARLGRVLLPILQSFVAFHLGGFLSETLPQGIISQKKRIRLTGSSSAYRILAQWLFAIESFEMQKNDPWTETRSNPKNFLENSHFEILTWKLGVEQNPFLAIFLKILNLTIAHDVEQAGRTVETLGMEGLSVDEILAYLDTGRRPGVH